jgi:hypothetical protein
MLDVECHGATDLNAYDLKSINCNATASGASDIDVFVEKQLNANSIRRQHHSLQGKSRCFQCKKEWCKQHF